MRLDRILQVFLPHHDRFYRHFEESIRFGLAAAETLLELAKDPKRLEAHIGAILILHTWGQNLLDHPHIHGVVTG